MHTRTNLAKYLHVIALHRKSVCVFLHISSSYAKILGETKFHTREISRSGSKAKDGEKKKKIKERLIDGNNNGQATHGACKPWRTQARMAHTSRLGQLFIIWTESF